MHRPVAPSGPPGGGDTYLRCCLCESAQEIAHFRHIEGHQYVRCNRCGLVFLKTCQVHRNVFYEDTFNALNNKSAVPKHAIEYWSVPEFYQKYEFVFKHFFRERLHRLRQAGYRDTALLDVGCGYGFFVRFCNEQGIAAEGIDTARDQVLWAQNHWSLDVRESPLEDFHAEDRYGAVVLVDVLEHVWNPLGVLHRIHGFLRPKGILAVQVPNLLGIKVPPGHSWGVPHHIWQFSPGTLAKVLHRAGFRNLSSSTGVMGVIGMYERGGPTLKEKLYMWLASRFHVGNRLMIICRKEVVKNV